ncbi:MAG TPA: peptidoglycan-binding domain-containing protein [Terriglobia bacterium]
MLHEAPRRAWYEMPQGVVVGVGPQGVGGAGGTLEVVSPQTLAPTLEAVRAELKRTLGRAKQFRPVVTPWELAHDFRKTAAEVTTMSRLLSELSVLLNVLVDAEEQPGTEHPSVTERGPDGSLRIKAALIDHLLAGNSIYDFPDASALWNPRFRRELLIFETLEVSIKSPFLAKLRPFLKRFEFDYKVGIGTILSAMALLLSLGSGPPPRPQVGPAISGPVIIWQGERVTPAVAEDVYDRSYRSYLSQLREGGLKTVQLYLKMLDYDAGPTDGKDGPKTQKAVRDFCEDQGVVCSGVQSRIFQQEISAAIAKQFPISVPTMDAPPNFRKP